MAHTPYHLLLSAGIATTEFVDVRNEIVIVRDFRVNQGTLDALRLVFADVKIVRGNLDYARNSFGGTALGICNAYRSISEIKNKLAEGQKYSNLFIFNNFQLVSKKTMQLVNISNDCNIIYVEDGIAAYVDDKVLDNINLDHFKWCFKRLFFNLGSYGHNVRILGDEVRIRECRVLFPEHVHDVLRKKLVSEISGDQLRKGIITLYEGDLLQNGLICDAVIVLLDLFSEVRDLAVYTATLECIVLMCVAMNRVMYVKYHPRETRDYMESFFHQHEGIKRICSSVPSEVLLYSCKGDLHLIATITTSFVTAFKLSKSIRCVSLAKVLGVDSNQGEFLRKIGVEFPANIDDLGNVIARRNFHLS